VTTTDARPEPPSDGHVEVAQTPSDQPAAEPTGARPDEPAPEATITLGAAEALPRLLKITGAVVGPATLLTALLFQFGRLFSAGYFRYYGVNFTVLDLTLNDYLVSGADGLWVPLAAACVLTLLLVWLHRMLLSRLPAEGRTRALGVLIPVAGVAGAVLMGLALLDLASNVRLFWGDSEAGGLSLAVGTLLVVYAVRLVRLTPRSDAARRDDAAARRRAQTAGLVEWGAAFLLVSAGLYWAAGQYAFGAGTSRAMQLQAALPYQPAAVIYSEKSLSLEVFGVTEVRCQNPDAAYGFRYDGLRLVRQAGNQYLLVAATWTRATGTAVLIPRGAGVRLEFRTAASGSPTC
jgi:hypothetical protein